MTANNADYSAHPERSPATADELFKCSAPVRSAEDLAQDGVFDDSELDDFLTDLATMRRADLA